MARTYFVFLLCLGVVFAEVSEFEEEQQLEYIPEEIELREAPLEFEEPINDETELVLDLLSQNLLPERFKAESFFKTWTINMKSRLTAFHWDDCGGTAAHIISMSVIPDPIKLPGHMNISVHAVVDSALTSPLETKLLIEKKVLGKWIKIPCIADFGSCDYDDLCEILYSATCPEVLTQHGIPCLCPYAAKNYTLPPSDFDAESLEFPGGDYHVKGELHQEEKFLACLELYLSIG